MKRKSTFLSAGYALPLRCSGTLSPVSLPASMHVSHQSASLTSPVAHCRASSACPAIFFSPEVCFPGLSTLPLSFFLSIFSFPPVQVSVSWHSLHSSLYVSNLADTRSLRMALLRECSRHNCRLASSVCLCGAWETEEAAESQKAALSAYLVVWG